MAQFDPDGMRELCTAVGFVVIRWASIERQLDNVTHLIHDALAPVKGHKEKPISLKKKLDFLKRAFKDKAALAQFQPTALPLIDKASTVGDTRHDLIHGTVTGYDGSQITLRRFVPKPSQYQVETVTITLTQFQQLATDLQELAIGWGLLASDLLAAHRRNALRP